MSKDPVCDVCGGKAIVFVTLVKNGHDVSLCFCQKHAESAGLFSPKAYGLTGVSEPADQPMSRLLVCQYCGFTHHDFNKLGRFGCAHCYEAFAKELKPILKQIHAGELHMGKVPSQSIDIKVIAKRIHVLNDTLTHAIKEEHYEEAAHVRDEILQLKTLLAQKKT
jgi:protein arginine kinase activator